MSLKVLNSAQNYMNCQIEAILTKTLQRKNIILKILNCFFAKLTELKLSCVSDVGFQ